MESLEEAELQVNQTALVIGGGIAGMSAARAWRNQGYKPRWIEKRSVTLEAWHVISSGPEGEDMAKPGRS